MGEKSTTIRQILYCQLLRGLCGSIFCCFRVLLPTPFISAWHEHICGTVVQRFPVRGSRFATVTYELYTRSPNPNTANEMVKALNLLQDAEKCISSSIATCRSTVDWMHFSINHSYRINGHCHRHTNQQTLEQMQ